MQVFKLFGESSDDYSSEKLTFTPTLSCLHECRVLVKHIYWLTPNRKQRELLQSIWQEKLSYKVCVGAKSTWHFNTGEKTKSHYTKGMWILELYGQPDLRATRVLTNVVVLSSYWPFLVPGTLGTGNFGPFFGIWYVIWWLKNLCLIFLSKATGRPEVSLCYF